MTTAPCDLALTPPFASDTHVYSTDVDNSIDTVMLTATNNHAGARISSVTLNGSTIPDTDFDDGITGPSLLAGDNQIVISVTAENNATTQTYTVTVTRSPTKVPDDWSLKPTDLGPGDTFRLIFLSSTKRTGSSSDIAPYNNFVKDRAAAGHTDVQAYSSGFRVVGCTTNTDARDNTATTGTGVPIYWLNGSKVADDYADFYDENWDNEANDKNPSGSNGPNTSQISNYPLTGCDHDGTEARSSGQSQALGKSNVRISRPNSPDADHGPISSRTSTVDFAERPMYGISETFQARLYAKSRKK